jgi:hypothetical protein
VTKSNLKLEQYLDKDDLSKVDRICQWFSIDRDFILDMAIDTFEDIGRHTSGIRTVPGDIKYSKNKKLFNKEFTRYALQWYIDGFEQFFIDYANGGIPPSCVEVGYIGGNLIGSDTEGGTGTDSSYYMYEFINYNGRICRVLYNSLDNPKFIDRSKIDNLYKDVLIWDSKFDPYIIKDKLVKYLLKYRVKGKNGVYYFRNGFPRKYNINFKRDLKEKIKEFEIKGYEVGNLGVFYVVCVVNGEVGGLFSSEYIKQAYREAIMDSLKIDVSKDIQKFIIERTRLGSFLTWLIDEFEEGYEVQKSGLDKDIEKDVKELIKGEVNNVVFQD